MPDQRAPDNWVWPDQPPLQGVRDPLVAQLLASRGVTTQQAQDMLQKPAVLHDPFELRGMQETVDVVTGALRDGRQLIVYGDYDADGVSSIAVLVHAFRTIGVDIVPYIPLRIEGYGLHSEPIEAFGKQYPNSCLISVDCGTSSDDVAAGRPKDMLMAITDHHLPLHRDGVEVLAGADSLINPKRENETYPFDGLAGAGVAYKLVQALEIKGVFPPGTADAVMPFAAIGTIADMMPLTDENRTIVTRGLDMLRSRPYPGVAALMDQLRVTSDFTATDLQFGVIPCINAAGRMQDADLALKLCISQDANEADGYVTELVTLNQKRREILRQAVDEALDTIGNLDDATATVVLNTDDWPMSKDPAVADLLPGVLGLVAGRIADITQRPTFAIYGKDGRGSARSRGGVNIKQALEEVAPLMERYGGHAAAAGFSLLPGKLDEFTRSIEAAGRKQVKGPAQRDLNIDVELQGRDLNRYLVGRFRDLEPFGMNNPQPLFGLRDARVQGVPRRFGRTSTPDEVKPHLKFTLVTRDGRWIDVVSWNDSRDPKSMVGQHFHVCGKVELDTYKDRSGITHERLQMTLEASKPSRELKAPDLDREIA